MFGRHGEENKPMDARAKKVQNEKKGRGKE